jgi:hypothetical protein
LLASLDLMATFMRALYVCTLHEMPRRRISPTSSRARCSCWKVEQTLMAVVYLGRAAARADAGRADRLVERESGSRRSTYWQPALARSLALRLGPPTLLRHGHENT